MKSLRTYLSKVEAKESSQSLAAVDSLKKFLARFGFITGQEVEASDENVIVAGIKRFQKFHGLQETGFLDSATRGAMMLGKCGNFRYNPRLSANGRRRQELYDIQNLCSWSFLAERHLTFSFGGNVDLVAHKVACDEVRSAINEWQNVSGVRFTETRNREGADIDIDWRSANDADYSLVGSDVIAHADYPGKCGEVVAKPPKPVHFDVDEHKWSPGHFNLWNVALHEIGHILGFRHSNDPLSVMYHSFAEAEQLRSFTSMDRQILRTLYP